MKPAASLALVVFSVFAFLAAAFLCGGCASAVEVRESRRQTATETLHIAARLVEASAAACPSPREWCPDVRAWSVPLASGLDGTADALERGGSPSDVGVCLAPVVPKFLSALRKSHSEIPPLLVALLEIALNYLPDCDVPPEE